MLLGSPGRVTGARPVRNLSDDPNRFELDPQGHVAAIREVRGTGTSVVGFYHSHPHSAPVPSARDLSESSYPDVLYVITGMALAPAGGIETRAFVLHDDGYEEVELAVAG